MIGIYCHHTVRFKRNTGIQRCLRSISCAFLDQGEDLLPLVWDFDSADLQPASSANRLHLSRWSGPKAERWSNLKSLPPGSWLLLIELVSGPHQPSFQQLQRIAKSNRWRLAAFFHDAIPLRWKGTAAECHRFYMQGLAGLDLVIVGSLSIQSELFCFWRQQIISPTARVCCLPFAAEVSGCNRVFTHQCFSDRKFGPKTPLDLLQVGSLEPRKNHVSCLRALAWLVSRHPGALRLHFLGWPNDSRVVSMVRRAIACGLPLKWTSDADDVALWDAYSSADITLYPSLEEGFGLPVLESLWLGVPCITSWVPALEGISGADGCHLLDSSDWRSLALALEVLLEHPEHLEVLQLQAINRPLRSWSQLTSELVQLMDGGLCNG